MTFGVIWGRGQRPRATKRVAISTVGLGTCTLGCLHAALPRNWAVWGTTPTPFGARREDFRSDECDENVVNDCVADVHEIGEDGLWNHLWTPCFS